MKDHEYRVWDLEEKKMYFPEDICRFNFNEGKVYAILLWSGEAIFGKFIIMDWTGLCDKDKKRGFYKDIVEDKKGIRYRIAWDKNTAGFWLRLLTHPEIRKEMFWLRKMKIVGNELQHPKLLKGKK